MSIQWLIDNWLPLGHRVEDTAPEGGFKTMWGIYEAVCIASGHDILGHRVKQGEVIIVDEETPESSLDNHLQRFSLGLGFRDWKQLPITKLSFTGFRFARKTEMDKLIHIIQWVNPVLVRFDSLLAMLPSGRQGVSENDGKLGEIIRDDLNTVLLGRPNCSTSLAVHSKKYTVDLDIDDLVKCEMQTLVRGHGSIVGEGCDTGYVLKKLSVYPKPTCFAIITKARRLAIPSSEKVTYVVLDEQSYGQGWARFREIQEDALPPSEYARALFPLFLDNDSHKASQIKYRYALDRSSGLKRGIQELLSRKVICNCEPQVYKLNPHRSQECNPNYLAAL